MSKCTYMPSVDTVINHEQMGQWQKRKRFFNPDDHRYQPV